MVRDVDLYATILGLTPPWTVVAVDVDIKGEQVTVKVDPGPGPFPCPECQTTSPGYDRRPRRWRHLDTCQLQTWIEADIPRVECPQHGVKQIAIPWAEPGSQFTILFERLAIDFLRECSVTGAAALLRITWDEAWGIKDRAVRRGLARRTAEPIPHLGIDEKAITKGHRYLTIVADLDRQRVLFLNDDRTAESLDAFWPTCTSAQRDSIKAVAMDMWEPYIQSVSTHVLHGDIVFDKFHIVKHLHEAVDKVRRTEHRLLRRQDDTRLTGTKYLWLRRPSDFSPEQRRTFRRLLGSDLKVGRAWALKERFRHFWEYTYRTARHVLHALVLARHPQPAETDGAGGLVDPAPFAQHPDLPSPPAHQCGPRSRERDDPVGEEDGAGLPQRRSLQDGHLFPLWGSGLVPTRNPVEPKGAGV